jgi:hypothetical protein
MRGDSRYSYDWVIILSVHEMANILKWSIQTSLQFEVVIWTV